MTKEGHKPKTVFTTNSIQRHERQGWTIAELHDPQDRLGKVAGAAIPEKHVAKPEQGSQTPPTKSKKGKGK